MEHQSRLNNLARRLATRRSRRALVAALGASAATLVAGRSARADDWWNDDLGDDPDYAIDRQPAPDTSVCGFIVDYASIIWRGTFAPGKFYYGVGLYLDSDLVGLSAHISVSVPGHTASLGWFAISENGQIDTGLQETSFDLSNDAGNDFCYDEATISVSVGPVPNPQCQFSFETPTAGC